MRFSVSQEEKAFSFYAAKVRGEESNEVGGMRGESFYTLSGTLSAS